jgi:hypothetical protein
LTEPQPSLEERVAALEERLAYPMMLATAPELGDEQAAKLEADFREAMGAAAFGQHRIRVLPPAPVLTPETAEALLRECVTVVKPGEVLAVRLPMDFQPADMGRAREYGRQVERETGVKVAFIPGEEFGVGRDCPGIPESRNPS